MKVVIEFSEKAVEQFNVKHGLKNIDCEASPKDVIKVLALATLVENFQKEDLTVNLDDFKSKSEDEKYSLIVSDLFMALGCIKAITFKGEEEAEEKNKE